MSDQIPVIQESKTPSIVIFGAIVNFFSAVFWIFVSLILLVFGSASMPALEADKFYGAYTMLMTSFSMFIYAFFFMMVGFHAFLGVALLRAMKIAWYLQIVSLVAGVVFFWWLPPCLILSVVMLIFFFMQNVRNHFKV